MKTDTGTRVTSTYDCISMKEALTRSDSEPSRTVDICNVDGANENESRIECFNHP